MAAPVANLIVELEGVVVQTVALTMPVLTIGREPDNALQLASPMVSRHHAELRLEPDGARLTDIGSANGTFVDGARLQPRQPHLLAANATVSIRPFVLRYQAPTSAEAEPAAETPSAEAADQTRVGGIGSAPPAGQSLAGALADIEVDGASASTAAPAAGPLGAEAGEASVAAVDEPVGGEASAAAEAEPAQSPAGQPPAVTNGAVDVPPRTTNGAVDAPHIAAIEGAAPLLEIRPRPSRPHSPAAPAPGPYSSYLQHLPVIFQDHDFLGRMLLIYESIWEPLEQRQDQIAAYFDPRTCPEPFLAWIAGWLEISMDRHWPEARRRALLQEAMHLYQWRGTRYGLTRMLEVCTGLTPRIEEDPEQPFVFGISVAIPPGSDIDRSLIESLVQQHKPAHTGYVLTVTP